MILISATVAAGLAGVAAIAAAPTRISYSESIDVDAPAARLFDLIRYQVHLMRWSAWPTETGSTCTCEGPDGEIGARTIFFDRKGERFGHQEVTALEQGRMVELTLTGKGPPQRPVLRLELTPLSAERTRVTAHFTNYIRRPFNLLLRLAGVIRWTRAMHRKDLLGLKAYAEPPHLTYAGEPAGSLAAA